MTQILSYIDWPLKCVLTNYVRNKNLLILSHCNEEIYFNKLLYIRATKVDVIGSVKIGST